MSTTAEDNPLLKEFYFPPFDAIEASHVRPGIRALLKKLETELVELEKTVEPTWPKLVEPLEKIMDPLAVVWGAVNHLKSVKDTSELRSAIEEVQPEKVEFELRLGQSKPLYNAFKAIRESSEWESLSDACKRIVESQIKEAILNGVSLEDDKKNQFNKIQQELARLSQKFGENVLDATKKFEKLITDKKQIEGLPATALGLAAQTAKSKGHDNATAENGPWVITLDAPSFMAVMQHARNRALREEIYCAYVSRASSGDLDNTAIIDQILKLRLEKAKLLGYNNYAEVSMATKMATVDKAEELLEQLRSASWNAAVQDLEDLKQFCQTQGASEAGDLTHWDISFWSERLRESKYEINEEELRPYFSLPKVMDGLFNLAKMLFGIFIEPADGLASVWNKDVRFYCVKDFLGNPIAYFYFDPYSRPSEKRGGAWMDEVVARSRVFSREGACPRLPVAHMVCNQMPPVGDKPSLMTFREVETVFHEFGHALQHMLTKQDEGLVAGIRGIEWDAVELPSQFMENWCYHRDTLMSIAKHYQTGDSLPEDIYRKLLAARTFRAGSLSLRQLRFACLDLELHSKYVPGGSESIYDVDKRVSKRTQIILPLPEDKFLCSFSHIFAGGYAAGYYSYKWAEVLSADAFSAFEDAGLNDEKAVKETGQRFRETILALGGGKAPLEQWEDVFGSRYWRAGAMYRGSAPSPLTITPCTPKILTKQEAAPIEYQKIIHLPVVKVVEVLLEFVGVRNLPEGHKGNLSVIFSKSQPDSIFNTKRRLSILSESGEKQIASFRCQPTGHLQFELVSHSPFNLKMFGPAKSLGSSSISLDDFLDPVSNLSEEKWLELVPNSGTVSSKPIGLHVALSFTIPATAPHVLHMVHSRPFSMSSCLFPLPGKVQFTKSWTCIIDEAGNEVISLQMRDKKEKGRKNSVLRKEIIGVTKSGEAHTLAKFDGTEWSLIDSRCYVRLQKRINEEGHLVQLVGHRTVKLFPGRRLEYEPKCCEKQRNDRDFMTVVEFSTEDPYGRAVALLDFGSGCFKVEEEWLVLPGITLTFILSDILRKERHKWLLPAERKYNGAGL